MRLFKLIFPVIAFFIGSKHLHAQIVVNDITNYNGKKWEVCQQDTFSLSIVLPASFLAGDHILMAMNLPAELKGGSYQSVSAGTLTATGQGTSNPTFDITINVNGPSTFQFNFSIKASCQLFVPNPVPAFSFSVEHYSSGNLQSIAPVTIGPLQVDGAQLNLMPVINQFYPNANLGVLFIRCFTYKNNGNLPFTGTFTFTDTVSNDLPSAVIRLRGISLEYLIAGGVSGVPVDNDSVVSITVNITNLMPNDSIVICDTLELIGCPNTSGNNTFTYFMASYGCAAETQCQLLHIHEFDYTSAAFDPNDRPDIHYRNLNPTNYCPGNPDFRQYLFVNNDFNPLTTNNGTSSGLDIRIDKAAGWPPGNEIAYIDTLTIHLYKIVNGVHIPIPFDLTDFTYVGGTVTALYPNIFHIQTYDPIYYGDTILLEFTEEKICIHPNDYDDYFNQSTYIIISVQAIFKHPCYPTVPEFRDRTRTDWNEPMQEFSLKQYFDNDKGIYTDLDEGWMHAKSLSRLKIGEWHSFFPNEVYIDPDNFVIEIDLNLSPGLQLVMDSIFLDGLAIGAPSLYPFSVVKTPVDTCGTGGTVVAKFKLPANYFIPNSTLPSEGHYHYGAHLQYGPSYDSIFNNFAVSFKLRAKCNCAEPGGVATIKQNFFLIYDDTCSPECKIPLASVGDLIHINCPGCYLPGWNLSAFDVIRESLGTSDTNNNNYPDFAINPPATSLYANEGRIMKNDTLLCHIEASISNGENLRFDNIGFNYLYGQLSLQGSLMPDLSFLGGTGTYTINGSAMSFSIPANSGHLGVDNQFYIMLDKKDWKSYGLDTLTFFEEYNLFHDVVFDLHFRLTANITAGPPPYFGQQQIVSFIYMSGTDFAPITNGGKPDALAIPRTDIENPSLYDSSDLAGLHYWCTGWEGRIRTVGLDFLGQLTMKNYSGFFSVTQLNPCFKTFDYEAFCSAGQPALGMTSLDQNAMNAFSFELRNIWQLDSIDFEIPAPYELDHFEIRYQVMTPDPLNASLTSLQCGWNNYTTPNTVVQVNPSTVRIYPWQEIMQINSFPGCGINKSFFDESKVLRISPIFRMKDCQATPLHYLFNSNVTSYWNNFPIATDNDTIIVQNISGDFTRPYLDWQLQVLNVTNPDINSDLEWNINIKAGPEATYFFNSTTTVENGFFWLGPANGDVHVDNVKWLNQPDAVVIGSHNGLPIYDMGSISQYIGDPDGIGTVRIKADYDCSNANGPDSLMLIFGDNCYSLVDTLIPGEICFMDTLYLQIPYESMGLQSTFDSPDTVFVCDTSHFQIELFAIILEGLQNHPSFTSVEDITITLNIPPGMYYVPGSGIFSFNNNTAQINPTGNTFELNTIGFFNGNFNITSNSIPTLDFDMTVDGSYTGGAMTGQIVGETYCGDIITENFTGLFPVILPAFDIDVTTVNPCPGNCNGSASVTVTTPGTYTYNWSTGKTDPTITDLCPGTYTITVTNSNGCSFTEEITIDETILVLTTSVNNVCYGTSTGTATVIASGGNESYTYLWDDPLGQQNPTAVALTTGTYNVLVTDANGCTATATVDIIENDPMIVEIIHTASCYSMTNGTANAVVWVGVAPFTYAWSPIAETTQIITNLTGGNTYDLVVTDYDGCTYSTSVTINTNPKLVLSISHTSTCSGTSNASATVNVTGGTGLGTYTYLWNDNLAQTTPTAVNLSPGTYTVVVTDAVGCTSTSVVIIPANPLPVVSISGNTTICAGTSTVLTANATGAGTLNYSWSPFSQTTPSITATNAGTFSVTVTDANGCSTSALVNVILNANPTVIITGNTTLCNGNSTELTAEPSGGTPGYTYDWGSGITDQTTTFSGAGTHTVTVTDANGCSTSATATITVYPLTLMPITTSSGTTTACAGSGFSLTTTGGLTSYQWYLSSSPHTTLATNQVFSPTASGVYCVHAVDANVCPTQTTCINITINPLPVVTTTLNKTVCQSSAPFVVGTHNDITNITTSPFFTPSPSTIATFGFPASGIITFGSPVAHTYIFVPSIAGPGVHTITYTVTNPITGCSSTVTGTITVVPNPTVTISGSTTVCEGVTTDLTADALGGTPGYTYNWGAGITTQTNTGIAPGTYTVTVTDANGCSASATVNVTALPQTVMNITTSNGTTTGCIGGTFFLTATSGISPYKWFEVSDPSNILETNADFTPPSSGNYCVFAMDANGCLTTTTCLTIDLISEPTIIFTSIPPVDLCTYNGIPIPIVASSSGASCVLNGPGINSLNQTFDPIAAGGIGSYPITYACTSACGNASPIQFVDVFDNDSWQQSTFNTMKGDEYNDVATDADGNVYVVGSYGQATVVDGGSNAPIPIVSGLSTSTFLAKYDKCANLLWVARVSNSKVNVGKSIVLDENHNYVYITGTYSTTARFNSAVGVSATCSGFIQLVPAASYSTAYVAQYDMNTGCVYFVQDVSINGSTSTTPEALAINETTGEIYVAGSRNATSPAATRAYILKYNPTFGSLGGPTSSVESNILGPSYSVFKDADYDEAQDRLWAVGTFEKDLSLPFTLPKSTNTLPGSSDAFIVCYPNSLIGSPTVFEQGKVPIAGGAPVKFMTGEGIAVDDATGLVCVTGTYQSGTAAFQTFDISGSTNLLPIATNSNAYMMCIDATIPSALTAWSQIATVTLGGNATGNAVDVENSKAYYTGTFKDNSININGVAYPAVGNGTRIFDAAYDITTGASAWTHANATTAIATGSHQHTPNAVAVNGKNLFTVGSYKGTMDFMFGVPASGSLLSSSISGNFTNAFILRNYSPTGDFKIVQTDAEPSPDAKPVLAVKAVPNPTNGIVEIWLEGLQEDDTNAEIQIYSLDGKPVYKGMLFSKKQTVDLSSLAVGTYLLTVKYHEYPVTIRMVKM